MPVNWRHSFFSAEGGVEVRFETGLYDPFFNVNTPDELDDARRMLEQAQ